MGDKYRKQILLEYFYNLDSGPPPQICSLLQVLLTTLRPPSQYVAQKINPPPHTGPWAVKIMLPLPLPPSTSPPDQTEPGHLELSGL